MQLDNDEKMQQWHQDENQVKYKFGGLLKQLFFSRNVGAAHLQVNTFFILLSVNQHQHRT